MTKNRIFGDLTAFEAPMPRNLMNIRVNLIPPESRVRWLHFCRW